MNAEPKTTRGLLDEVLLADLYRQVRAVDIDLLTTPSNRRPTRLMWHMHPEWHHIVMQLTDSQGRPVARPSYNALMVDAESQYSILGYLIYVTTTARNPELRFP
jgi:hypothetical protein